MRICWRKHGVLHHIIFIVTFQDDNLIDKCVAIQRCVVKLFVADGVSGLKSIDDHQQWSRIRMLPSRVYEQCAYFRDGQKFIIDDARTGASRTVVTDTDIFRVERSVSCNKFFNDWTRHYFNTLLIAPTSLPAISIYLGRWRSRWVWSWKGYVRNFVQRLRNEAGFTLMGTVCDIGEWLYRGREVWRLLQLVYKAQNKIKPGMFCTTCLSAIKKHCLYRYA
jgi:hypothetical protein